MPNNLTLTLSHGSGQNGANESTYAEPPGALSNVGVIFTKQGVVVKETASITLPIADNTAGNNRIDVVVCRSKYIEVPGGEPAEYVVYTGTPALNPSAPSLSFPNQEVVIGYLYIPAGAGALDEAVVWVPALRPAFANDGDLMYTNREQVNTHIKRFQTIGMVATSASVGDGDNYIALDTFEAFGTLGGGFYEESSGTFVDVNVGGDPGDVFRLISIQAKSALNRVLWLRFVGVTGKTVKLAIENFLMPDPQIGTPWDSVASGRKDLEVHEGDVVCVIGEASTGALWRILSVHSGKIARLDRSLTMQHRIVLNSGTVVEDGGTGIYIDWRANIIDVECTTDRDLSGINPSDGAVQEANLPAGYEIQIVPRWTGAGSPFTRRFRLMAGGNILLHNDKYVLLPWGRPATLIALPGAGGTVKWMLKDYMEGLHTDFTDEYTGNNANIVVYSGGGTMVFATPAGAEGIWYTMRGTTCEVSIYLRFTITGTVTSFGLAVPPLTTLFKTGGAKELVAGVGQWTTGAGIQHVVAGYGATAIGDFLRFHSPNGGLDFETGTLRAKLSFETYNSF